MDQLKQTLISLSTPPVPKNLENRVLAAVHATQQHEITRWYWINQLSFIAILSALISSVSFLIYRLNQTGTSVVLETLFMNRDAVSVVDAIYVVLESLPLGSLAMALIMMTGVCVMFSFTTFNSHFKHV